MGFRFRKSFKLIPGVRINLSKSGISTSVGVPGATVNFSKEGTRTTVGIPGAGITYSERHSTGQAEAPPVEPVHPSSANWPLWVIGAMFVGMVLYGIWK